MRISLTVFTAILLAACSQQQEPSDPAAGSDSGASKPVKLIYNSYLTGKDAMADVAVREFARDIEAESEGSIQVTIPAASLAQQDQQWSLVSEGVADIALTPIYSRRSQVALPRLAELPLNSITATSASVALWKTQQKYFSDLNEFEGYKLLSMNVLPPSHYFSIKKPIETYTDLKGMKIWTSPGVGMEVSKAVGAVPISSEFMAVYEYVSKGTVDAAMLGAGAVNTVSLGRHFNYMARIPGGMGSVAFAVIMNEDSWNKLSQAQQEAVLRAANELPRRTGASLDHYDANALAKFDHEVMQADADFMDKLRNALAPIRTKWIETAQAKGLSNAEEVFDFYMSEMRAIAED